MIKMRWTNSLSVGHEVLDQHHQHLFAILDRMEAGIGDNPSVAWAQSIIEELLAYADYHFREEERILERVAFPFLDFHRASHNAIAVRVQGFVNDLESQPTQRVLADLHQFLAGWLTHHIEIEDFEYAEYVADLE